MRTEAIKIENGRGELAFDLPAEWAGEIEIRSYAPNSNQQLGPPHRVTVMPAQQLNLVGGVRRPIPNALPGLASGLAALNGIPHRPGEQGHLSLAMRDRNGKPVVGALSLTAVDEAVYSVFAGVRNQHPLDISPLPDLIPTSDIKPRFNESDDSQVFSLKEATMPQKIQEVEAAQSRGHLRTLLGWALLVLLGFAYVCYRVWEEAPKSFSVAALMLAFGVFSSATLVAGCSDKKAKVGNDAIQMEARGGVGATNAMAKMTAPLQPLNRAYSFGEDRTNIMQTPLLTSLPRIRRYFPETMLWKPELITDDKGRVDFDFDFADSITTWRLAASAVTADGRLGGWRAGRARSSSRSSSISTCPSR